MKMSFSGLESTIDVIPGRPFAVEIANPCLFARVVRSLVEGMGEEASEPYSLWDDDGTEVRPGNAFLAIMDPFNLPWEHRTLVNSLNGWFEQALLEDEDSRLNLERCALEMESVISRMAFQLDGDYSFSVEWSAKRYLKAFGFRAGFDLSDRLVDNLIAFVDYASDVRFDGVFLTVNLKSFLNEDDIKCLYDRVFFQKTSILLLENAVRDRRFEIEDKLTIDLDFLEK